MRAVLATTVGFGMLVAVAIANKDTAQAGKKLWAGVSVSHPVLERGTEGDPFRITFGLVNDGAKTVDPQLTSSELLVNGDVLKDWCMIVASGPRDERWNALPAGDSLTFSYGLGDYFKAAGTYRLSWKGKSFQSAEVVFRVLDRAK